MTRRQSFAIYCKTGWDVRRCDLNNEQITYILNSYYGDAHDFLKGIDGAKHLHYPSVKGQYLQKEYDLLIGNASKKAKETYETVNPGPKPGRARVVITGLVTGFGRYLAKHYRDAKTGPACIMVDFFSDAERNRKAAEFIADYISPRGRVTAIARV